MTSLVAVLLMAGCATNSTDNDRPQQAATVRSGSVDPQVFDDMVATSFPIPGPNALRRTRVLNFTWNFTAAHCGVKEHFPIDRTWERQDQDVFPDLGLIKRKGFAESNPISEAENGIPGWRQGCDARSKGNLVDSLPSYEAWMNLSTPWLDVLATVEQDPSVVALKNPFAQCLRAGTTGTGIEVSSTDPAPTFLTQVDEAYYGDRITTQDRQRRLPSLYAKCGREYFDRTQHLLEAQRPAMIERNRELLDEVARDLVAMGYVP